ncbi:hypothetical protein, partial [Mesorhizobium sp.]|uniref:hypothetical protein n=1 Tax=Mesorhizobium sp. TaxID=1871066 RepID=UPI002587E2CE
MARDRTGLPILEPLSRKLNANGDSRSIIGRDGNDLITEEYGGLADAAAVSRVAQVLHAAPPAQRQL